MISSFKNCVLCFYYSNLLSPAARGRGQIHKNFRKALDKVVKDSRGAICNKICYTIRQCDGCPVRALWGPPDHQQGKERTNMSNETACFYTVSELEGKLRYDGRVTHRSDPGRDRLDQFRIRPPGALPGRGKGSAGAGGSAQLQLCNRASGRGNADSGTAEDAAHPCGSCRRLCAALRHPGGGGMRSAW